MGREDVVCKRTQTEVEVDGRRLRPTNLRRVRAIGRLSPRRLARLAGSGRSPQRPYWSLAGGSVAAGVGLLLRRMTREFDAHGAVSRSSAGAISAAYAAYAGLLGAAAWRRTMPLRLPRTIARPAGELLIGAGAAMVAAGMRRFASPEQLTGTDAGALVTGGIYRWSRNPQYLGLALVAIGVASVARSGGALVFAFGGAGVFVYWVRVEERALERHFDDAYRRYRSHTSRWLGVPA